MKLTRDLPFKLTVPTYIKEAPSIKGKEMEDEKKVIMYVINVGTPINNWKVKHRYNDFYNLQELLLLHFPELPKLPPKTLLPVTSASKLEKRRKELEKYLNNLLLIPHIMSDVYFSQFLNTSTFFPDYLSIPPKILCRYEAHKSLTFTDISYVKDRHLNYVLCSKGIKAPLHQPSKFKDDDDDGLNVPTEGVSHKSILNGFKFDSKEPVNIFQDKKVVKTFDLKAHCLQYFPEAAMIVAGFSNGIIAVYKEERKPRIEEEYTLINISKFKAMNDRVTKIMIHSGRGEMYALGQSNKIKVIDMAFWTIKNTIKIGDSPILAIHLDESCNLGLSTNPQGELLILDISKEKPEVKKKLKIANEPINLMDCDIETGRVVLTTIRSGRIFLVDIEFPFNSVALF